jgi:hypothetical protein
MSFRPPGASYRGAIAEIVTFPPQLFESFGPPAELRVT